MLHEAGAHTAVEVVRAPAPPPVVTATGTPEGLPPRAVCDGLALRGLPSTTVLAAVRAGADRGAVQKRSPHSTTPPTPSPTCCSPKASTRSSAATPSEPPRALDTLNRGEGATAEPQVVATPRTGTTLTHRALVLLGADPPRRAGWPTDGVRAQAEPRLAAWAGHLLGDPRRSHHHRRGRREPVDARSPSPTSDSAPSTWCTNRSLPRVLREHAGASRSAPHELDEPRLAAMLAIAENIHDLLAHARAGTGLDLARPQDRGGRRQRPTPADELRNPVSRPPLPDVDGGDRSSRLGAARAGAQRPCRALAGFTPDAPSPDESAVAAALDALAAFGITPGGDPAHPTDRAGARGRPRRGRSTAPRHWPHPRTPQRSSAMASRFCPAGRPSQPHRRPALATDPVALAPAAVLAPLGGATKR